jgi:hypothetical protein
LGDIATVPKEFPAQFPAQTVYDIKVPVINGALSKVKGAYLSPIVNNQMQLKAIKPSCRGFSPCSAGFEHFMAVDTPVMAYFQGG